MKKIRNIIAIVTAVMLTLSLSACHPKDEVAVNVTDKKTKTSVELSSADYLYALINATMEAQQLISQENSDEEEIKDFSKYKVVETNEEGKETKTEYYKWIDNRKEELLRDQAGAMIKTKDLKLKLDENTESMGKYYASMYWSYYYASTFEKNGVSYETYEDISLNSYYKNQYFLSIYDKDGTNPVDEKIISEDFYANYVLANAITIDIAEKDETTGKIEGLDLKAAEKLLKGYKDRLADGEKFEKIYHEYEEKYMVSEETEEDHDHEHDHSAMAVVYGSERTTSASEYFKDIDKMKKGAVKILTSEDKSQIILV